MTKLRRPAILATVLASMLVGWLLVGPAASILDAQSDPSVTGAWSQLQVWPSVAVHAALLPTGKVIFFSYADDSRLWDPATGAITTAATAGFNIFCSGFSFLPDGRLFVAGGHISPQVGLKYASIYDAATNTWSRQPDMNAGRWYPTTTTLADGSVLVVSGDTDLTVHTNPLPQVWSNGVWRDLSFAQLQMPLYPSMFVAPNGQVFNPGPQAISRWLNTAETGQWESGPVSNGGYRSFGSAVMYEPGKVLIVGGGDPPTATAEKIDLNLPNHAWQPAGTMARARRQINATLLPDGKVLVTGGSSGAGFDDASGAVHAAELWDPALPPEGAFTELASNTRYRGYHSIATLLPDGRVLSAGGDNEPNAEVFSPPYLFKGARPSITGAPSAIRYGASFLIQTPVPASVSDVTLVRLAAVTHAIDMNQRFVRLAFSQAKGKGTVSVMPPASGHLAPPGHYMLFLLNSTGVPSIARIVRLSNDVASAPSAPTALTATGQSGQITLTWTDTSNNETGFEIQRSFDGQAFTVLATVDANVRTWVDKSPGSAKFVYYRMRAFAAGEFSAFSNTVKVRIN